MDPWLTELVGERAAPRELRTDSGARLLLWDDVVVKVHRPGTDAGLLAQRLALCRAPLLSPLAAAPFAVDGLPPVTLWPRAEPLSPDDTPLPWNEAGALLARLHGGAVPSGAPRHGWPERLARAAARAAPGLAALGRRLSAEAATLPEPATLVHGDWHLGQLGRTGDGWCLLDPDDLGAGDPAWDLARPAGFWAAGLLPEDDWHAFLDGYRAAGGPAVPATGDPWPALDLPARCAVFVAAARPGAHSVHTARKLQEACRRMAQLNP